LWQTTLASCAIRYPKHSIVSASQHHLCHASLDLLFTVLGWDLQGTGRCGSDRTAGRTKGRAHGRAYSEKSTGFCCDIKAFIRQIDITVKRTVGYVYSTYRDPLFQALIHSLVTAQYCVCTFTGSLRPSLGDSCWTLLLAELPCRQGQGTDNMGLIQGKKVQKTLCTVQG
jgi:hypothetical protein